MTTSSDPHDVPESAREVLSVFVDSPATSDTVEGIARWRILQWQITYTVDEVGLAVDWLLARKWLVLDEYRPGAVRLNREQLTEAREFVGDWSDQAARPPVARGPLDGPLTSGVLAWIDTTLQRFVREHGDRIGDHAVTYTHESIEMLLKRRRAVWGAPAEADSADDTNERLREVFDRAHAEVEPLVSLHRRLRLKDVELHALLLALAPELDAVYSHIFMVLNADMNRRTPTLGLICDILGSPLSVRDRLADAGGLSQWRLLAQGSLPAADEPLALDPAIVAWVLGDTAGLESDPRLTSIIRQEPWPGATWLRADADLAQIEALRAELAARRGPWVVLYGEDASGTRAILEAARQEARVPLLRILLPAFAAAQGDVYDIAVRLARCVAIRRAVPAIDTDSAPLENGASSALSLLLEVLGRDGRRGALLTPELERVVGLLPRGPVPVHRRPPSDLFELAGAYRAATRGTDVELTKEDAIRLARIFPLSFDAIAQAVRLALLEEASRPPGADRVAVLTAACRRIASPDLPRFARRVEPAFGLDDVVLPPDRRAQLDEIVAHVRQATQVLHAWGFAEKLPYGRGVAALFFGVSGTGKTMAAQAIARALRTDTYVVDLSRLISKYIGESEKNIDVAFRDAQRAGAVLQIDEAEALFGKRSEIKDSHDRYANLEVAYLLQRMEAFEGVAILTTNLRENLDAAFLRRLRFVIEFPRPDATAREEIWQRALPRLAPFRDINIRFLARRLDLTGGNIGQIAIRAAFLAAAEPFPAIEMRHVLAAAKAELVKLGQAAAARDLAEFETAQRDAARVA